MRRICCFAGHSELFEREKIYEKLISVIEELIVNEGVNEFLVGNYGAFDKLCASAVNELKKSHPDIKLYLTIPYLTTEINENPEEYYKRFDGIQLANIPESTPKKLMIIKCNQFMIDSSSFLVSFVEHSWGGAYRTLQYAQGKDIKIINLSKSN